MKVLAVNDKGEMTYCTCPPELRGQGRCNHVDHQKEKETIEGFIERINSPEFKNLVEEYKTEGRMTIATTDTISQESIENLASEIDKIAGCKVTSENILDVLKNLDPDQVAEIAKIGFDAAPRFSLPITPERYEDENMKNKLYFANLPDYGISGKASAIMAMFDRVGPVNTPNGIVEINSNYMNGLTEEEYFELQCDTRASLITKAVGTAKPGYCIYENSIVTCTDVISLVDDGDSGLKQMAWKNVKVGSKFEDGSIVEEIRPWTTKPCIEIKIEGNRELIISNDHLISADMSELEKHFDLSLSEKCRENINESDGDWICAKDIYDIFSEDNRAMLEEALNGKISYVKIFKEGKPQRVRCITTSTGSYLTNGLISHNTARKMFYAMSDTLAFDDCGGAHKDVLSCSLSEGHICVKCASKVTGGERIKSGDKVGGIVSTNLSEALTQLSMDHKHISSTESNETSSVSDTIINATDGWGTNPIIQDAIAGSTTEERRQRLADGLKKYYKLGKFEQDDFNIQMMARKMTSYKRGNDGIRPLEPGELCDIISVGTLGNVGNIFKTASLNSGYKHLTRPIEQKMKPDASLDILG